MANAKITLYSFYRWFKIDNDDLFSELVIPEELDREQLVNTMLMRGGEFEVIYDNADFVKWQIGTVSKNWLPVFEKWVEALAKEYDPLENYDRKEDWTDNTHGTSSSSANGSASENGTDSVSAYNSSALVTDSGNSRQSNTNSSASGLADSNSVHSGRIHGNIGVTTNDQMLDSFMKTRSKWGNIYNHIADVLLRELIIPVY